MAKGSRDADRRQRRNQIETTLANYPRVDPDGVAELIAWFENEARIADMARIARSPELKRAYAALKADHIDRLKGARLFWSATLGMLAAMTAMAWVLGGP